ncbi:hypothetical protein J4Q44_G00124420 [Coregonus suidteri]|uniref:Uncharacterized protein n=1 Tax=Coregonus suidteri TaxID=861788 RepID=A0AAN8LX92_9TELE
MLAQLSSAVRSSSLTQLCCVVSLLVQPLGNTATGRVLLTGVFWGWQADALQPGLANNTVERGASVGTRSDAQAQHTTRPGGLWVTST